MTRYFLDTTAHIERWAGDEARQAYVRNALGHDTHATSLHALREWKHIVEGTCVDILNALAKKPTTLSEVLAVLSQGWGRTTGHRMRVLAMATAGEAEISIELIEMRVERLLRVLSDELFHAQMDEVRAESGCGLAQNEARRTPSGKWTFGRIDNGSEWCKQTDAICRQDEALEPKKADMEGAARALIASTPHKKIGTTALEAATDVRKRKGKACITFSDVSIALECGGDEVLLTTDKSFELMAPVLGMTVERFSATPPP